jgi:ABC-type nitrate/sulfonate/bicarbonate transport system permease component
VRSRARWLEGGAGWAALVLALLAWEGAARLWPSRYFPPVGQVLATFREVMLSGKVIAGHILPSLRRMAIGYGIAVAAGTALGGALGYWRAAFQVVEPVVEFLRAIPPPVLIPFTLLLLGLGDAAKIAVIAFGCLWPVLLNAIDGTRNVNETFKDTARLFGRTSTEIAWQVVVPAALPQVFAGMRTSLSLALIMMVLSEMIASSNGVGYFVLHAQRTFDVSAVYSGILLLGLFGYAFNRVFVRLEGSMLRWHRGYTAKRL